MLNILKDGALASDEWTLVDKTITSLDELPAEATKAVLPLALWIANSEQLAAAPERYAVWLDSDDSIESLSDFAQTLQLVCVNFPAFTDGRGYSIARQLRSNLEYTGELRAIGNVLRDQLQFYRRCGFDSFAFADEPVDPNLTDSLEDFSVHYQDAADDYTPPFARR